MSEASVRIDLGELYGAHRDALYRTVVLATDDRDLALDAVDGAFAAAAGRGRRHENGAAEVLRRTIVKVRRAGDDRVRGFRAPDAQASSDARALLAALRGLDITDRFVILGRSYLRWDDGAVAIATGLTPQDVAARWASAAPGLIPAHGDGTDHPADDPLTGTLQGLGDTVAPPLPRLEAVTGEARVKRLGMIVGAVAVVAVIGSAGFVAVDRLTHPAPDQVAADQPAGDTRPADGGTVAAGTLSAETVAWSEGGLPFRQGEFTAIVAGPDGFVAVGTDWNDPSGNQSLQVFSSETGFDWTVEDAPLPAGGWINDLRYIDGRFVGVGSSFDERRGIEQPVLLLGEDGQWTSHPIESEPTVEIGEFSITVGSSPSAFTVDGDAIVVLGSRHSQEDLFPLIEDALPDDLDTDAGWGTIPGGIAVYGPTGETVYRATAAELGLPPELFTLMNAGLPTMWRSTDGGETWETESLAGAGGISGSYIGAMVGDGDTLLAIIHDQFAAGLWRSDDGTWERVQLGEGATATAVTRFGDHFYAAGNSLTSADTVWRSPDGHTWEAVGGEATAELAAGQLRSSPSGLIAVGQGRNAAGITLPAVVVSGDLTLTMDAGGRFIVTDGDGDTILSVFSEDVSRGPDGRLGLVDPETGDEVLTVTQQEVDQAWEQVFRDMEVDGGMGGDAGLVIAASRDGETWHRVDNASLGTGFLPTTAALGSDAILLSGYEDGGGEGGPTLWVGELGG